MGQVQLGHPHCAGCLVSTLSEFSRIQHYQLLSASSKMLFYVLYRISGSTMAWFYSYLTDRTQPFAPHSAISTIEACSNDFKNWMVQNKLKLFYHKMEALLCSRRSWSSFISLNKYFKMGETKINFESFSGNLWFILAANMSVDKLQLPFSLPVIGYIRSAPSAIFSLHTLPTLLSVRLFYLGLIAVTSCLQAAPHILFTNSRCHSSPLFSALAVLAFSISCLCCILNSGQAPALTISLNISSLHPRHMVTECLLTVQPNSGMLFPSTSSTCPPSNPLNVY